MKLSQINPEGLVTGQAYKVKGKRTYRPTGFDRISGEPYKKSVAEKVVYRNGQHLEDVSSYVNNHLNGNQHAEIVLTPILRRPSKDLQERLDGLFKELAKTYIGRIPVENGCYPVFEYDKRSLVGHLHFDRANKYDGIIFEDIINRIDKLRKYGSRDKNKRATIILRIETYLVENQEKDNGGIK